MISLSAPILQDFVKFRNSKKNVLKIGLIIVNINKDENKSLISNQFSPKNDLCSVIFLQICVLSISIQSCRSCYSAQHLCQRSFNKIFVEVRNSKINVLKIVFTKQYRSNNNTSIEYIILFPELSFLLRYTPSLSAPILQDFVKFRNSKKNVLKICLIIVNINKDENKSLISNQFSPKNDL
jgi:hypothetical protein